MLPTLLVWDFNGTILDDGRLLVDVNNQMNRERGLPEISYDFYRNYFDHPPLPFYLRMGYDFKQESYAKVSEEFLDRYEKYQEKAPLMPHVLEVLTWAKERGIPQIIVSAHEQRRLEAHLHHLGIASYFDHVSGENSQIIGGKVERARALARSGQYNFSNACLIGDTTHDYAAAQAMNCYCILYSGGHQSFSRLRQAGAPIVSDLSQIPALLEQLS